MTAKLSPAAEAEATRLIVRARLAPREIALLVWRPRAAPIFLCNRSGPALRKHAERIAGMGLANIALLFEHDLRRSLDGGGRGVTVRDLSLNLIAAHCRLHEKRIADARPDAHSGLVLILNKHAGREVMRLSVPRGSSLSADAVRAELAMDRLGREDANND